MQLESNGLFDAIVTQESSVGEGITSILISNKKVAAASKK